MKGWFMVGFERELTGAVTPAEIGKRRLIMIRRNGAVEAFDGTCPHRGAHLGCGGRLVAETDQIQCPFHGYLIGLGEDRHGSLRVARHPTLAVGGMLFVQISSDRDNGWSAFVESLARDHWIVNGFEMVVASSMKTVIENAFDQRHFRTIHGVRTEAFSVRRHRDGALIVDSTFHVPAGREGNAAGLIPATYQAFVASPGLAAVTLGGPVPYTVITGATDRPEGGCTIRLSLAFPKAGAASGPPRQLCEGLLDHSRRGLEEDRRVWETLSPVLPVWMPDDQPCRDFLAFCEEHDDS